MFYFNIPCILTLCVMSSEQKELSGLLGVKNTLYTNGYKSILLSNIDLGERVEYRMLMDSLYRGIVQTPYH